LANTGHILPARQQEEGLQEYETEPQFLLRFREPVAIPLFEQFEEINPFIAGTLRKSTLWESTAVPELRQQAAQAAQVALQTLNGQWQI